MDIATGATSNGQDVASGLSTAERKLRCDMRWKQLSGARLKAVAQHGDNARLVGEEKIVEYDPVRGQLYQWEIEYRKRQRARGNGHDPNSGQNDKGG